MRRLTPNSCRIHTLSEECPKRKLVPHRGAGLRPSGTLGELIARRVCARQRSARDGRDAGATR